MIWSSLTFIHWRVDASVLRMLIPAGLGVDEFDGTAWVGLVPFTMPLVRHVGWPKVPTMSAFHECNVRTYVTPVDGPRGGNGPSHDVAESGVWFFSLDAASRLAVWGARRFWNLPYFFSRIDLRKDGERTDYRVARRRNAAATLDCSWEVAEALPPALPGSLEYFLTERYALYTVSRHGRLMRGRVEHRPWPLRRARVTSINEGLVSAAGIRVMGDPLKPDHIMAADSVDVLGWVLESVRA